MNTDIRLAVDFDDHPKIVKLQRRLGEGGVLAWIRLLCFAGVRKPSGLFDGMDDEDLAIAAKWSGEATAFVNALTECRLLDVTDGVFSLHDWTQHNGYACHAQERSEHARMAAEHRWRRKSAKLIDAGCNAPSMDEHCDEHGQAMLFPCPSNAPNPNPDPDPNPNPNPYRGADVFMWAPTRDGVDCPITLTKVAEWRASFPGVDVEQEIRKAVQWSKDAGDLKTSRGMAKFIGSWLGRCKPTATAGTNGFTAEQIAQAKVLAQAEQEARYAV